MSKGRRYDTDAKLNMKKVFAVIIAIVVFIVGIIMVTKVLTKAKNTKPLNLVNYFALYQDEKWGILGSNGEIIINPMYQEMPIIIDKTKDVFLCTYDIDEQNGTYKTKVINSKNEEIWTDYDKIEAIENYDESQNVWYEENILKVQKNGKWGLINLEGTEIAEIIYDDIQSLKGIKNSIIVKKDGNVGLINSKGNKILDTTFSQILSFGKDYKNGYITVNQDNKYGIININGDKILDNNFEKIYDIYSEKYFVIEENGKQILIDKQANHILTENYDKIVQIANSGIVFVQNEKYGVMDFNGNVIITPEYENVREINVDIFEVKKDGKVGVINKDKEEKIAFSFKEINYNKKAGIYVADDENYQSSILDSKFEVKIVGILSELNADDGYMKIKIEDNYKYYNFKFEEKTIEQILTTNKIFVNKKDGKYGYIDEKGNQIVEPIYEDATELNEYGYGAVKKDGLWGAINQEGNIIIEPTYNLDENLKINFIGKWHLGLDLNMNYYCDK